MTVSIQKFRIIVLISNQIEYWSNHSIWFEISDIRTALQIMPNCAVHTKITYECQLQVVSSYWKFSKTRIGYSQTPLEQNLRNMIFAEPTMQV